MRKRRLTGGILAALAVAVTAQAKVVETLDEFTGQTIVTVDAQKGGLFDLLLSVHFTLGRDDKAEGLSISQGFVFGSSNWKYLECNHLLWLLDDKRWTPSTPETDYHGEVLDSAGVSEYVLVENMALADLVALAAARTIRFKVCNDAFSVPAAMHDDIRVVSALFAANGTVKRPELAELRRQRLSERVSAATVWCGTRPAPEHAVCVVKVDRCKTENAESGVAFDGCFWKRDAAAEANRKALSEGISAATRSCMSVPDHEYDSCLLRVDHCRTSHDDAKAFAACFR